MSRQFKSTITKVARNTTVFRSIVDLVRGIQNQIEKAGVDEVALRLLCAALDAEAEKMAQAVVDHTDQAPHTLPTIAASSGGDYAPDPVEASAENPTRTTHPDPAFKPKV